MSEEKYEGIRHTSPVGKPTYVMIPRKLIISLVVMFSVMLIMTVVSTQAAYFVDRRSNQRWCGIILLFDETYKREPPPTDIGKILQAEFRGMRKDWCK